MEPVHLLWLGDPSPARQVLATRAPHVRLTERGAAAPVDSLLADAATADLLVVDATLEGIDALGELGRLKAANIDLPVVLLTWPDVDDLAARAGLLAVCDVVVKVAGFALQLLPAMEQVRARHDLLMLFRGGRGTQDRLRTILELQPAVTCIVGADLVLSAMNQAGLMLLGVEREQLAGRAFSSLLPPSEQERVLALVRSVCLGEAGELDHLVVRPDGRTLAVRTRAVPLGQGDAVVALATMVDRTAEVAETSALIEDRARLTDALQRAVADTHAMEQMLAHASIADSEHHAVGQTKVADRAAIRQLRADLARFMADIDDRCRALVESDSLAVVHGDE